MHHFKVKQGERDSTVTRAWLDDLEIYPSKFEIIEAVGELHLVRLTIPVRAVTIETIERPEKDKVDG